MNIIMSYRQWESIGKKAGWRRDETDDNLPAGWPFGGVKKELFSTYLKDVDSLLQANYGTTANDTNAGLIQSCYGNGESPKECVTQIAEKYNLETLDPSVTMNTKQAANAEFVLWGRRERVPWTKLTNNTSHAEMKRRQKDGWEVVRQLKGSHPDDILKPPATTGAKKEIKQAAKPYDLLLRPVRVTFSDGDVMTTNINGSNEEIEQYYLTNDFVKDDETTMHHGVKVEFLDELSSAPDSIQDLILLKPFGIVLKAIKALGEESIAGFSGVTEADVPDVIRMCEPHELAEILQSIEKLEKLAEKTAGTIEKGKDVTDRQIITESKKATNCPRCGQRYQRHPDRAGHESIMQCPKCFLNYSPECESGQSAVYDPTTGTVKTGPTEKIFPPQPKPDTLRSRIEGA